METKIHIYDISTMKILHSIETTPNPRGICAFSSSEENCYLAYPGSTEKGSIIVFDALTLQVANVINAHKTPLSKLSINQSGTLVASASAKGTVIRIFSLPDAGKFYQFRRGSYPATVYSIAFSEDSSLLCVSSETGTIHIFKIDQNASSSLSTKGQGMSAYLPPMFSEMWDTIPSRSFATGKLPSNAENICAINQTNSGVIVASADGHFYQYSMDSKMGGELKLSAENTFIPAQNLSDTKL